MKKRYFTLLLIATAGLGVFVYNYWSYSCGRCTADTLLTLGMPAKVLIGINALAFAGLLFVRFRHKSKQDSAYCVCGAQLHSSWRFCPNCGHVHASES